MFDVSIECYLPGQSQYSLLFLIECKDYKNPVPVDDIEEFYTKTQQVGSANSKAVVVSTNSFQSGAFQFAKSKGMGLARYFSPESLHWCLHRSPSRYVNNRIENQFSIEYGLSLEEFDSDNFEFFMLSPIRSTNFLETFFQDFLPAGYIETNGVLNNKSKIKQRVPFYSQENIEIKASDVLSSVNYTHGEVNLDSICQLLSKTDNLKVIIHPKENETKSVLGRISFDKKQIDIFQSSPINVVRDRFTLAHELAHYLLGHGIFLKEEYFSNTDHRNMVLRNKTRTISILETQANMLAASVN